MQHKWNEVWLLVKTCIYELPHELPNDWRLRILRNQDISGKSQTFIELLPNAYSLSRNENFVSTSKNLLKNKNSAFLVVHYFT